MDDSALKGFRRKWKKEPRTMAEDLGASSEDPVQRGVEEFSVQGEDAWEYAGGTLWRTRRKAS